MGDPDGVRGFWLQAGPAQAVEGVWGANLQMGGLVAPCPSFSLLHLCRSLSPCHSAFPQVGLQEIAQTNF